ncbi:DNA-directed RNA polymerase subunit beta' [Candidatus Vidania fulgoroideorum]
MNKIKNIFIKIASPKKILSWSYGEVKSSETINYRTFKPEFDGIFCQRIFGPIKDFQCYCGKHEKGGRCNFCGVEIISSKERRRRMGHIELQTYLVNPLFFKISPSKISIILNVSKKNIEKISNCEKFIVKNTHNYVKKNTIIDDKIKKKINIEYGSKIKFLTGGKAIFQLLKSLNLKKIKKKSKKKIIRNKNIKNNILRYRICESFIKNNIKPQWMVMKYVPVLPPDLRPIVELENGNFASSDINELYRRLINRNNRLKVMKNSFFPESVIRKEKKLLQDSLNALMIYGDYNIRGNFGTKKVLKSISENLKGKNGRFRQNLLGKRVDYSARSVIVVEPEIKLNECFIPKIIAYELFKPFIIRKLLKDKYSLNIKSATFEFENKSKLVFNILKKIVRNFYIILNRAPTLHRLGIQSFKIKLTKEKAIKINPLVCFSYNADFDGDQMAVHLPISYESNLESRFLLSPYNNLFLPSNGNPTYFPNQDIILGLYLLTKRNNNKIYNIIDIDNVLKNLFLKKKNLNKTIIVRYNNKKYITTYGRVELFELLNRKISFDIINKTFCKNNILDILKIVFSKYKKKKTFVFIEKLLNIGLEYCTKLGFSFSYSDIKTTKFKKKILSKKISKLFFCNRTSILLNFIKTISCEYNKNFTFDNSPIKVLIDSGAKSNLLQINQISSIRGFMYKPNGKILKIPIISNLKEGMDSIQYFLSTNGARKGLSDTSIKTADSGYLTRKLVESSHNLFLKKKDCKSNKGFNVYTKYLKNEDIIGRFLVRNYFFEKIYFKKKNPINKELAKIIIKNNEFIYLRSPLFCKLKEGICCKCYGFDLSKKSKSNIGDSVGIIAAQSIGEPGTQLTMRTFHMGGVVFTKSFKNKNKTSLEGYIRFSSEIRFIKDSINRNVIINIGNIYLLNNKSEILEKFKIKYGYIIYVNDGQKVNKNKKIYQNLEKNVLFVAKKKCKIKINLKFIKCEKKKINNIFLYKVKKIYKKSFLKINKRRIKLKKKHIFIFRKNYKLLKGDRVLFSNKKKRTSKDITKGLSEIVSIFESRKKKEAIIAPNFCVLKTKKNKKKIILKLDNEFHKISYKKKIIVSNNKFLYKGQKVTKGRKNFSKLSNLFGRNYISNLLINKIRTIYENQNVYINIKHFEVIIKQMLSFVLIKSNNKYYFKGEKVERKNLFLKKKSFYNIVEGITKIASNSSSFISSASFQETNKILSKFSISCKNDPLLGLKENVITSNPIPSGTGFFKNKNDNKSINKKR